MGSSIGRRFYRIKLDAINIHGGVGHVIGTVLDGGVRHYVRSDRIRDANIVFDFNPLWDRAQRWAARKPFMLESADRGSAVKHTGDYMLQDSAVSPAAQSLKFADGITLSNLNNMQDGHTWSVWAAPNFTDPSHKSFGLVWERRLNPFGHMIWVNTLGQWQYNYGYGSGSQSVLLFTQATAGQWQHVVIVWDLKNTQFLCYRNGVRTNTVTALGNVIVMNEIAIGSPFSVTDNYYIGRIGRMVVHSRPLSPGEVATMYNKELNFYIN